VKQRVRSAGTWGRTQRTSVLIQAASRHRPPQRHDQRALLLLLLLLLLPLLLLPLLLHLLHL
jgi:hypothetical protein